MTQQEGARSAADKRALWLSLLDSPGNDESVAAVTNSVQVAKAVEDFFGEHEVASLRLPAGWFGRPYDNWHELNEVTRDGNVVVVRLDEVQVLRLHVVTARVDGLTLRVTIRDGYWEWTSYGRTDRHHQQLEAQAVEFDAPSPADCRPISGM